MKSKVDTRSKILDTAEALMLREGFHGVTVDRLIAQAGISKGSFFYHFASKDALPPALLERFLNCQGEAIHAAFASAEGFEGTELERALSVVDAMTPIFSGETANQQGCMMAAFAYQLIDEFPALRSISQTALLDWQSAFGELFAPLCSEPNQAEEMAVHLMTVLQGAHVIARLQNNCQAIHDAIKHFKLYLTFTHSQA